MAVPSSSQDGDTDYAGLLVKCFADAATPGSNIFVGDIPKRKIDKAVAGFAKEMASGEKPVVLVDTTVLGSVKKGLLFTDRRCYHQTDSPPGHFAYADVHSCSSKTGWPSYELNIILRGGDVQKINFANSPGVSACEMFCVALNAAGQVSHSDQPELVGSDNHVEPVPALPDPGPKPVPANQNTRAIELNSDAPGAPIATKVGGFLGLVAAFILWNMIGGIIGLIIASIAVPILSIPFIILLNLLFGGGSSTTSSDTETPKEKSTNEPNTMA